MANLQLYLAPECAPCRSVWLTACALGVKLHMEEIDLSAGENMTTDFLQMNPEHTVPTITDGGFILWESRAIMRYLVGKYGGEDNSLYPQDLKKRAVIDMLLDKDLAFFSKNLQENQLMPFLFRKPVTTEMLLQIIATYEWFETQLQNRTYLTGNDVTIADFAMVVSYMICETNDQEGMDRYPVSKDWYRRMKRLPYFDKCNQAYYDQLEAVGSMGKVK